MTCVVRSLSPSPAQCILQLRLFASEEAMQVQTRVWHVTLNNLHRMRHVTLHVTCDMQHVTPQQNSEEAVSERLVDDCTTVAEVSGEVQQQPCEAALLMPVHALHAC